MSFPSKLALGVSIGVSGAIIGYVHYKQSEDRLKLHQGVLRDVEQQQRRKHENTYTLQQQIDITKQLKASLQAETSNMEAQAVPTEHKLEAQAVLAEHNMTGKGEPSAAGKQSPS